MRPYNTSIIVTIIFILFLVLSCSNSGSVSKNEKSMQISTPIPTVVEPGLASGYPCAPPCWRGIVPGQSIDSEVEQAIEQLRADGWAHHIIGDSIIGYEVFPLPQTTLGSVEVTMDKGVAKTIEGDIEFDYPIGTVIEQFGPPEAVRSTQDFATCLSCDMWKPSAEFAWTTLTYLLYPEQGFLFWGWIHPTGTGCLCPEMQMNRFCYYEPLSMSEALNNNYLADLCLPALKDITEKDLVEWNGFGGGY